jgi:hypothetical protein
MKNKEEMKAEAVIRMKLLGLSQDCIDNFKNENRLTMTSQERIGESWTLGDIEPSQETLKLVKQAEAEYGALVYYIHEFYAGENMILYSFLVISKHGEEWEYARKMAEKGLPDCISPVYGFGGFEYGELPVEVTSGGLFRKN